MNSEKFGTVKIAGAIVAVLALVGVAWWWTANGTADGSVVADVICSQCGHKGTVPVGDTPTLEEWPRECPNCKKDALYLSMLCLLCHNQIPLKDPNSEQVGMPKVCPVCKKELPRGS